MVLDSVVSPHTRRNYAKALDDLFALSAGRPLTRALLMEYRATHGRAFFFNRQRPPLRHPQDGLGGSQERDARRREAANLTGVPNIPQKGTRLGNWLTREQAKELLAVPDRSTLKGKRDYVILDNLGL